MDQAPGPPPMEVSPHARRADCDWSREVSPVAAGALGAESPKPHAEIGIGLEDEQRGANTSGGEDEARSGGEDAKREEDTAGNHGRPAACEDVGRTRGGATEEVGYSDRKRQSEEPPHSARNGVHSQAEELSDFERFRAGLRKLVGHGAFMGGVYLVIGYDTFLIAHDDLAAQRQPRAPIHKVVEISDWVILVIFTLELMLKLAAYGAGDFSSCFRLVERLVRQHAEVDESSSSHSAHEEGEAKQGQRCGAGDSPGTHEEVARKRGYKGFFASAWNQFDFVIVVSTWVLIPVQYLLANDETVGRLVRLFRIARPLRAFRSFDGTKDVLKTFPRAIPDMGDVLALLSFIMVVYAILGINLFGLEGQFHGRCVVEDGHPFGTHGLLLKGYLDDVEPLCGADDTCPTGFRCSCKARLLPPDNTLEKAPYAYADPVTGDPGCVFQEASRSWSESGEFNPEPQCPRYGWECFDSFGVALYTIFTKVTLDSWTSSMWWAQDAAGEVVGLIFFLSLVGVVAFNVVNLNVAVISTAYQVRESVCLSLRLRLRLCLGLGLSLYLCLCPCLSVCYFAHSSRRPTRKCATSAAKSTGSSSQRKKKRPQSTKERRGRERWRPA